MTSSLDRACLKPKLRSFSDEKMANPTTKDDIKAPGITTTRPQTSAREKKTVYEISRIEI